MCQDISSATAARTGQVVCLPSRIWAWRALGERGPISSAGTLMGLHCHLAKAAWPRDWQRMSGVRNGFPLVLCVHFFPKGMGTLIPCITIFTCLIFSSGLWEQCLGRNADMTWLGKIRGGIRGISHLQIYLLIWKGSQMLIDDKQKRE